ncbi:endo-1,4-beta-xylanase-like [Quillaja saponaria]|uniref:Endo-1,4-beta-xylanase-like n=1 Tax=Quillaja saponaria TaxID=32244 RepID=A0AAD7KWD4_QUISA|nr:endo-1,4-beta-xylanase-like [Quillaja saponaria]
MNLLFLVCTILLPGFCELYHITIIVFGVRFLTHFVSSDLCKFLCHSAGFEAKALSYDYTAIIECLANPQKPQYSGGIIINPELNQGLEGWSAYGEAKIVHRELDGNKFILAHSRNQPHDSISQKLYLQKDKLYTFSAWIQVSEGNIPVNAVFKTTEGLKYAGAAVAKSNCWSMLKGGFTVDTSGSAELYFESNTTSVEIWVDSISLQPFTQEQWRSHQDQSIEKTRKRKVKVQAVDKKGNPIVNAKISIEQNNSSFPLGCAVNLNVLNTTGYRDWFTSRFKFTVFEDELKWYNMEHIQGQVDYSGPDALLKFAKEHSIAIRGHNIHWDSPHYQPSWVSSLSPTQLNAAVSKRVVSLVTRYKHQFIAWDTVNENVHFSFLESNLGQNASSKIYKVVHKIDGTATLFLNEFNTIEDSKDGLATPAKYLQRISEIRSYHGNQDLPIGIGLEAHFTIPNLPYMRASLDTLGATGFPIWLTELDVSSQPNQALYLEQILREAHSHPKIQGIMIWSPWKPQGCYRMCLTDNNFNNLPTGDVVDKLAKEWGITKLAGTTDAKGFFEASLFHGDYEVKVTHPTLVNSTLAQSFKVMSTSETKKTTKLIQVFV